MKCLCITLVLFKTVLYPFDLYFTLTGILSMGQISDFSDKILYWVLNVLNLICLTGILFYSLKLFKFCIPNIRVPWSSPNTKQEYFLIAMKLYTTLLICITFTQSITTISLSVTTFCWIFNSYLTLYYITFYDDKMTFIYQATSIGILILRFLSFVSLLFINPYYFRLIQTFVLLIFLSFIFYYFKV